MFEALGAFVTKHRRIVFAAWLLVFVAGIGIGGQAFGRLKSDISSGTATESSRVDALMQQQGSNGVDLVAIVDGVEILAAGTKHAIQDAAREIAAIDGVELVVDHYATGSPELLSRDGRATAILVTLENKLPDAGYDSALASARKRLEAIDVGRVSVTGPDLLDEEAGHQAEADLQRGELISLPVVLLVLLLIFGGIVGAGLPIVVALFSVSGALLLLLATTFVTDVSVYSINIITMLGLGLAIDYSLLIINRFREQRATGTGINPSLIATVATAGRTVLFSALTVAVALTGLIFFHDATLRSLAYGGIGVVMLSSIAALTLLPALLSGWGHRIKPAVEVASHDGFFFRLSRFVQRRAIVIVGVTSITLAAFAIPFLGVNYGWSGVEALPRTSEARRVAELWEQRFDSGGSDPIVAVVPGSDPEDAESFAHSVTELEDVVRVDMEELKDAVAAHVFFDAPVHSEAAKQLVEDVRDLSSGTATLVGGETAALIDYQQEVAERLPFALGAIAGATFILLFLMTGSVVVPLKAILMNILSLTASFGVLIWGFQEGNLSGLLSFDASGGVIDIFVPILVFVLAFGLSMDYEVFLLARIKEEYDRTGDNDRAVALGLQRTGRTVTCAAILIVAVFAGFAAGGFTPIKAMGVGMATAVIIDATIVRMLLVPAAMKLMGDRNWWAPRPLRLLHERYGLRETNATWEPAR